MMHRAARAVSVLALAVALAATAATGAVAARRAASPSLAVSPGTLPADRISTVTVTGKSYLVPPHAPGVSVFGGVYVFFGWVAAADHFGPSIRNSSNNDGTVGVTYAYPGEAGDAGTRDDGSGSMRLISFTKGGASGEATDFHMDDNGNWSTTLRIFGATFTTTTAGGGSRTYDCRKVQCGVFTIGAHGVASATNEKFTPVKFQGDAPAAALPRPSAGGTGRPPSSAGNAPRTGTSSTGAPAAGTRESAQPGATGADLVPGADGDSEPGQLAGNARTVRSTGGVSLPVLATVVGLLVVLAGGGLWWRRRRRSTSANDLTPPVSPQ
ncbi:LPXTG cell wall anchor domain-containing protein [Phytohabitans sp. ZYX-F-186]|uniref:LPXTG cell wall anchor domain-containing protein n=1 Tax=Phytohabitans maris TaxID=3071409 RepID=A0ABU0ZLX8_9ACTN|nr:LPXTG cell wall anchor domain-containing protein [Phytohabitans sp. ZYX-F-186]MDQ7908052.1 LPXTG cell wall anchor domain-containing protein [Phytohabitans sp. ZYX-F-186]